MRRRSRQGWFETLRRDRGLFALVGVLALFFGWLQPIAVAKNAEFQNLLVLCSGHEAESPIGQLPEQGSKCPACVTGHHCCFTSTASLPAQLRDWTPRVPVSAQPAAARNTEPIRARRVEAPPSIRAPPFSA